MIRVLVYVAFVFLLAAGFAWLAERPGELVLTWQGYEIRTSLMVAAIAAALALGTIALVGAIIRAIINTPSMLGHFLGARRRDRGYRALSRGMIAVGAGDVGVARKAAGDSRALLGDEPLVLLLTAQAAQMAGDGTAARQAFEALSAGQDTKILGLHGLFIEARRQGEHAAARHFAEEASRVAPKIGWAGSALFEYQSQARDWRGALQTLSVNSGAKIIEKDRAKRLRAVLLTAQAMEIEGGDPEEARVLAQEAHRLAPDLVPAATTAARLLKRQGDFRRAARVLEANWKTSPHPDVAGAYASVRPGESVRDRLRRVRRLADLQPNHPDGAVAIAKAAIDAHDWPAAREALDRLVRSNPSEQVCLLMAEIEQGEHGDQGRVRSWLNRAMTAPRDPAWVADGQSFERWAPVSPISGRVDAFEWKVTAQHLPSPGPVAIEMDTPSQPREPTIIPAESLAEPAPTITTPVLSIPAEVAEDGPATPNEAEETAAKPVGEGVAILRRAPDDPGPEPAPEPEDAPRRFRFF